MCGKPSLGSGEVWKRDKIAKAAQELADHLQIVENVKAIQTAQKELADAIKAVSDRVRDLEANMRALKAEASLDALKETQNFVVSVQGGFNERMENVAVRLAGLETAVSDLTREEPIADPPRLTDRRSSSRRPPPSGE